MKKAWMVALMSLAFVLTGFSQDDFGLNGKSLSAPNFVDIDADGDFDAFCVETGMSAGSIYYFQNIGTADYPAFERSSTAEMSLKHKSLSALAFVDIDNDGDMDAFGVETGMSAGKVFFCENTGTKEEPFFGSPVSNPFKVSRKSLSALTFVDIDSDGDFDAFGTETGMSAGKVFFFENTGTKEQPSFGSAISSPFGFSRKSLSSPTFLDVDGDGDLDAFGVETGMSAGKVFVYENVGTKLLPEFSSPKSEPFGLNRKSLTAPTFIDINQNGVLDVYCVETGMSAGNIFITELKK